MRKASCALSDLANLPGDDVLSEIFKRMMITIPEQVDGWNNCLPMVPRHHLHENDFKSAAA